MDLFYYYILHIVVGERHSQFGNKLKYPKLMFVRNGESRVDDYFCRFNFLYGRFNLYVHLVCILRFPEQMQAYQYCCLNFLILKFYPFTRLQIHRKAYYQSEDMRFSNLQSGKETFWNKKFRNSHCCPQTLANFLQGSTCRKPPIHLCLKMYAIFGNLIINNHVTFQPFLCNKWVFMSLLFNGFSQFQGISITTMLQCLMP